MTTPRNSQDRWDGFFYGLALDVAAQSKDPHRQVGAVLARGDRRQLSFGYNGLPSHIPDDEAILHDRERKNRLVLHAERNCLAQSPFMVDGGCTLYVTRFPCYECAKAIALAGVVRIVCPEPDLFHERWGREWRHAVALLSTVGVKVQYVRGEAP